MAWKVPLFRIYWDESDIEKTSAAIRRGMYWAEGPEMEAFGEEIEKYTGSKYCVLFNNGTSALHASLLSYGISTGDEVIVPSFTFISTANSVLFVGAKPVFADIEELRFGLDPDDVNERITAKTKAIIAVHYGGAPCDIRALKEIAEDHALICIEDAAESFGAETGGKKVGSFGNSAMFSFCQNKIIATGEGGAIVTDEKETYERLRLLCSHGRTNDQEYFTSSGDADYVVLGYNFRMSNITAALGLAQISHVENLIGKRRDLASRYSTGLKTIPEVKTPGEPDGERNVYQLYSIRCPQRDELKKHLAAGGIMSKVYFTPVHHSTLYKKLQPGISLPVTERVFQNILTIPLYPTMTRDEQAIVLGSIRDFYGKTGTA
jgi:dTDP-4-amino-4,6-dideoxygalactose transaminase